MPDRGMLIELCVEPRRIARIMPLHYDTPIADGEPAAALVAPAQGPFREIAETLGTALSRRTGVELPLLDDAELFAAAALPAHLIAVGHAGANQVLRRMHYLGMLDYEDYPSEGLQVTSIHNPLGDGHNVLAALGAAPEVAAASAQRLVECVEERGGCWQVRGRVQIVEPAPQSPDPRDILERAARVTADSGGRPTHILECLRWLRRTGEEGWARAFVQVLRPYADGSIPLSCALMSAVDFWTDRLASLWGCCETFEWFSDEERLMAVNFLVACAQYCHDSLTFQKWRIVPEEHQVFNHHTFPALGLAFSVRYLRRHGYDLPELDDWSDKADRTFARAAQAGRSFDEGGAGYSWLVPTHLMRARFAVGDLSWARSRKLLHCADLATMVQNNHFETVPYGDCGAYHTTGTGAAEVLLRAAEMHADPGHLWVARQHAPERAAADIFTRDLPAEPPQRHVGLFVLPLDPVIHRWAGLPRFPGYPPPPVTPNVPAQECFDKLSLRGGWAPDDDYLLLQGFGDGQHGHPDANAISQYQARGRLFLVDNDYIRRWPKQHNTVMVLRAGEHGPIPSTARLDQAWEFEGGAVTRTTLLDYNGCDWTRTIIWLAGDCVLVIDGLQARVAAQYELRCYWRTLGEAEPTGRGMHAEHSGQHFHVVELTDSERRLDVEPPPVNSTGYPTYNFGDARPKVLCESQRLVLAAGEEACFVNLLVPGGGPQPRRAIAWDGAGRIRVTGDGPQVTVSAEGATVEGRDVGGFETPLTCLQAQPRAAPTLAVRSPAGAAQVAWEGDLPAPASCLAEGPDGAALVGCADGSFGLVAEDGTVRLLGQASDRVGDILCGRLFDEQRASILVAAYDASLRWLDAEGAERLRVELPRGSHMPAWGTCLCLADLDGDGRAWPIVGTAAWRVHAVTPEGGLRWTFHTAAHSVTDVAAGDLNGDGREEIAVGTVYFCVPAITADGGRLWEDEDYNDFWNAGPVFPFVRIADVDGDGEPEVVTVGSDTLVHCIDCRGIKKWTRSIGDEAAGLVLTDAGIVAASLTGDVHLLDGQGRRIWRARLGSPCTALAALGAGYVVALEDGRVIWLDDAGAPRAAVQAGASCSHLLPAGERVLAATSDGRLLGLNATA
ncbi:MAG: hypothetical protein AB7Y46_14485 [Armatimonadota bacterium]